MLVGTDSERAGDLRILRQLLAEAAAELLRGNQAALPRHQAVVELIAEYEDYERLVRL
jgi:hypothetical protein